MNVVHTSTNTYLHHFNNEVVIFSCVFAVPWVMEIKAILERDLMKLEVNSAIIDRLDSIFDLEKANYGDNGVDVRSEISRDIVDRLDGIQKWVSLQQQQLPGGADCIASQDDREFLTQARSELEMDIEHFWRDCYHSQQRQGASEGASGDFKHSLSFWNLYLDCNHQQSFRSTTLPADNEHKLTYATISLSFWDLFLDCNSSEPTNDVRGTVAGF